MPKLPLLIIIGLIMIFPGQTRLMADTVSKKTVVAEILPGAKKLGSGRLTFLGWSIYEATLYSQVDLNKVPETYQNQPFALKLNYHISAKGKEIARRSVNAIRHLGFKDEIRLAAWYRQMHRLFPDVKSGSEITGFYIPGKGAHFYQNCKHIGTINDPDFAIRFYSIWLSKETQLKQLRRKLLGLL